MQFRQVRARILHQLMWVVLPSRGELVDISNNFLPRLGDPLRIQFPSQFAGVQRPISIVALSRQDQFLAEPGWRLACLTPKPPPCLLKAVRMERRRNPLAWRQPKDCHQGRRRAAGRDTSSFRLRTSRNIRKPRAAQTVKHVAQPPGNRTPLGGFFGPGDCRR